ncbi:MAG: teichuronic acid biosynthesis glycosyltransferase TuaC [Planctomycetota bacterium]|jgi:teichuronic acid biosynthesis glycosyltransferase TuaC
MHLVTFSNLFPSSVMPGHGTFVYERMRRVAAASGCRWSVVAPVPEVIWPLRRGIYKQWADVPSREQWQGVDVYHPRFRHWPGMSQRHQANAVAAGAKSVVRELLAAGDGVLDAHYLWPDGVAAAKLAEEFSVPFTLTARGTDVNVLAQDASLAPRIAEAAARAHACMAVSDALSKRFAAACKLPESEVVTVRNGVDLERFVPGNPVAARRALGLPEVGRIVVSVGRLVAGKGFDVAVRAVRDLPNTTLVLVGDGPERSKLAGLGGDRVKFLGVLPATEVATAYQAADVFVLPSHREGWPNVVTEALASGLPVVATPVGGIPQILGGEQPEPFLGALVPVGDVAGFAVALQRVLDDEKRTSEVRAFAERYGWQEPIEHLVQTFRRACGEVVA